MEDARRAAFHRLLKDAGRGGQARVDALVAFVQRTVFMVPWPNGAEGWRTLTNAEGAEALPIFTQRSEAHSAGTRFGWADHDGAVSAHEIGARAALRYALEQSLSYVIVDIAAPHALEVATDDVRPILSQRSRLASVGSYDATFRSRSGLRSGAAPSPALGQPKRNPSSEVGDEPGEETLLGLAEAPGDELLAALREVLRAYPEVDWACLFLLDQGGGLSPVVGVRVNPDFRERLHDIRNGVQAAIHRLGQPMGFVLLDEPNMMRSARSRGMVCYPWRRRPPPAAG